MAFEYAVAFVALSITRDLTVGDRLVMEAIGGVTSQIADATAPIPIDLLDAHIRSELGRMKRSRFFERSEEQTSELQSLMSISYAVFCLKKKNKQKKKQL